MAFDASAACTTSCTIPTAAVDGMALGTDRSTPIPTCELQLQANFPLTRTDPLVHAAAGYAYVWCAVPVVGGADYCDYLWVPVWTRY